MRKGIVGDTLLQLIGVAIVLVVIASIVYLIVERNKSEVNNLQSCGGLIGSLGGGEGYCHTDKTCTTKTARSGFYWQYGGEGLGCSGTTPICCIEVKSGRAPIRAAEIAATKCFDDNANKLVYVDGEKCFPDAEQSVAADQQFGIRYYYSKEDATAKSCTFTLKLAEKEFLLLRSCPATTGNYTTYWAPSNSVQSYLASLNQDPNPNNNVDLSILNKPTVAEFILKLDSKEVVHRLNVGAQSPKICSWTSPSIPCRTEPEGQLLVTRTKQDDLEYTIRNQCTMDADSKCTEVQYSVVETTTSRPVTCASVNYANSQSGTNGNLCLNKQGPCYVRYKPGPPADARISYYYTCLYAGTEDVCVQTYRGTTQPLLQECA